MTGVGTPAGPAGTSPATAGERRARLGLSRVVEPGHWAVYDAVQAHGAQCVYDELRCGRQLPGLSAALVAGAAERARTHDVDEDLRRLAACGGRLLCPGDEEWPEHRLTWDRRSPKLAAPPLALQVRGERALGEVVERSVALVGARAATAYGEQVARELGLGLADRGLSVLSGGAYGIDAAAHRGALDSEPGGPAGAGGPATTVAVLACGVDVAYPRGNDRLLARVAARGLLVSEHPPGSTPTRARFLVRNRLIAALSCGTVVVEAALRSGSLSTAGRAHDLVRQVMAVPGPVTSALSAGCHSLLRGEEGEQPVTLVTGAREVLDAVGHLSVDAAVRERGEERVRDALSDAVCAVLDAVPVRGGAGEATLARDAGVPVRVVQQAMPALLVAGLVQRSETGWRLTPLGAGRPAPQAW